MENSTPWIAPIPDCCKNKECSWVCSGYSDTGSIPFFPLSLSLSHFSSVLFCFASLSLSLWIWLSCSWLRLCSLWGNMSSGLFYVNTGHITHDIVQISSPAHTSSTQHQRSISTFTVTTSLARRTRGQLWHSWWCILDVISRICHLQNNPKHVFIELFSPLGHRDLINFVQTCAKLNCLWNIP